MRTVRCGSGFQREARKDHKYVKFSNRLDCELLCAPSLAASHRWDNARGRGCYVRRRALFDYHRHRGFDLAEVSLESTAVELLECISFEGDFGGDYSGNAGKCCGGNKLAGAGPRNASGSVPHRRSIGWRSVLPE